MAPSPLPIDDVLPWLLGALRTGGGAVLRAPTGAGKTTRVPPALLDGGLAGEGMVVMLEPRRIAARAAARRIAEERGATVGGEVGWQVRFDRRAGRDTRILVVTEGILVRMLQRDPLLESVGALVFDEFHERRLDGELALAMARRVQREARPDLRLVAMSATAETAPLAAFLGDCPVVAAEGRLFPVEIVHLPAPPMREAPEAAADAAVDALRRTGGDVLVFLPGAGEIRRAHRRLEERKPAAAVCELYGDLPPGEQDAVLRGGGGRRIILATNVAETSVTVEGVTAVVDSGLARVMRFDPAVGMPRLNVERISRSSADQRAGRAGRLAEGLCLRLWTAHDHRGLPAQDEPEVRRVDLAGAVLELLAWGERDIAAFPWFDPPDPPRLASAMQLLERLGAVASGSLTPLGRRMAQVPAHPRLARLLLEGGESAGLAAALLSERDATRPREARHRSDSDLLDRLDADLPRHMLQAARQYARMAPAEGDLLRALFAAYPDRLARRREPGSRRGLMSGGRGVVLHEASAVTDAELFLCLDLDAGSGGDAVVRMASKVERDWLPEGELDRAVEVRFHDERVSAVRVTRWHDLVLDETPAGLPADGSAEALLAREAAAGLDLAVGDAARLLARLDCLRAWMPELGLPPLDWRDCLPDLCRGLRSFDELRRAPLEDWLRARLGHGHLRDLDRHAPERITVPSGSRVALSYEPGKAPVLAVRMQELFGVAETPRVAGGRVPVLLHLLAPNRRPQQVTDDLASFWRNVYPRVRRELRARYPRHSWPEDPAAADPERRPRRKP